MRSPVGSIASPFGYQPVGISPLNAGAVFTKTIALIPPHATNSVFPSAET